MKRLKFILLPLMPVLLFVSCVSIKSDYPDITYYNISPDKEILKSDFTIAGSVLVRSLDISNIYDTEYILVNTNETVKKYFYHRWADNYNNLATDFIVHSLISEKVFADGVYTTATYVTPDYILEGYIVQLKTVYDDENKDYFVELIVKFNMLERLNRSNEPVELFNDQFVSKVNFEKDRIEYVVPAFNIAMNNVTNELFRTIAEKIK